MNTMKRLRSFLLIWIVIFAVGTVFSYVSVCLDIRFNAHFFQEMMTQWHWYDYIMSRHGSTVFYLLHPTGWLILHVVITLVFAVINWSKIFLK